MAKATTTGLSPDELAIAERLGLSHADLQLADDADTLCIVTGTVTERRSLSAPPGGSVVDADELALAKKLGLSAGDLAIAEFDWTVCPRTGQLTPRGC